jgi:tetratricopeptide (TPR) repeat protein
MTCTGGASNRVKGLRVGLGTMLLLSACDMAAFTANRSAGMFQRAAKSLDQESDMQLAREAAPALVKTIDGMALVSPHNEVLLELSAQAYCSYTFGFVEDELETLKEGDPRYEPLRKRATGLYRRCEDFGLRRLREDDEAFPDAINHDVATLARALKKLDADDAPGLFWTGFGLASQVNLNRDDMDLVAELPKAELIMRRVVELDERFYNAGAHLALGLIYASQGRAMGGDPDKGRQHLERAIALTGGKFLLNKVMFARIYAVTTQQKDLYKKTLEEVLQTPADVMPEQRLANEIAHKKADRYLKQIEDLF